MDDGAIEPDELPTGKLGVIVDPKHVRTLGPSPQALKDKGVSAVLY
jgi:hypothetical protein